MYTIIKFEKQPVSLLILNNVFILKFKETIYNNHFYKKGYDILLKYFIECFILFYVHVVWRGKAFRVRFFKKKRKYVFYFGYSHWSRLFYKKKFMWSKKIRRQSFLFIFNDLQIFNNFKIFFNNIRIMNRYTRRGIRVKNSPLKLRFGKVSQVQTFLHDFN